MEHSKAKRNEKACACPNLVKVRVRIISKEIVRRLPEVPKRDTVVVDELLQRGIRLFNDEEFFQCHEVLEEAWMPECGPRRLFLQALIHLAVGFYHCQRTNQVGAGRQLRKGLRKLAAYLPSWEGIDTARLHRDALAALERIEAGTPLSTYPQIHSSSAAGS